MDELEVTRLRAELRVNKKAYTSLQKEKNDLSKALSDAQSQILQLNEELELRERLFSEYRETKEKEFNELLMIKQDLEMRLKSALEMDEDNDQQKLSLSIGRNQAWWSQSNSSNDPQLSCTEAMDTIKCWEGMDGTMKLFHDLQQTQRDRIQWSPGSAWNCKWKPQLKIYISTGSYVFPEIEQLVIPELEGYCKNGGCSLSSLAISLNDSPKLGQERVMELCLEQVKESDVFISIIHSDSDMLTKSEVEYGFINNPAARPSLFVFLDTKSPNSIKLKQRINKLSNLTKIIESQSFNEQVVQFLVQEGKNILKSKFDIDSPLLERDQKATFSHLSLLSDMRGEYEQYDILQSIYNSSPVTPTGIDITFQSLTAYMNDEQSNVAPFLITAPPGSGKSTLLAKWYQYLQEHESGDKIEVLYHFVPQPCSSQSETCIMYRRFIHKLNHLCGNDTSPPSDPTQLEDTFTQLLDMTSARLKSLNLKMVFILIDNVDLLVELNDVGWILKPLPQHIRVILTANEGTNCPDSWRSLPVSTLPSPTATDLQEVISGVTYGSTGQKLTEDQVISLTISSSSDSSQLWCIMAAKYILSCSSSLSVDEVDELIESLGEAEEIPELARLIIDEFITKHSDIVGDCVDKVLQLIFWSRNGLSLKDLKMCCNTVTDTVLIFVLSELQKLHILHTVAGLYRFTNDTVQQLVSSKYDTDFDHLIYWSDLLINYFSDLSKQPLARATSELLWLLKRSERQQDLINSLLNIDILVQLYCGGESALLLRYWHLLRVPSSEIPQKYYNQLLLLKHDEQVMDRSMIIYVAMLFRTTGKILKDLGLGLECQLLLQHSLELCEAHSDPDSLDVGNAMYELASLYAETERFSAAESFYKQALEVFEHDDNSKEILKVLSALSSLYETMKRPDLLDTVTPQLYAVKEKNRLLQPSALSILKRRADELEDLLTAFEDSDIPSVSDILAMNEWSLLHASFGDKKVAEKYLLSNLSKGEEVLGEDHPVTMSLLKNMITFYQQINSFRDAIPLQTHLVELKTKQLGSHTSVAAAHNNLAIFHCCLGEYDHAIHHYDSALGIYKSLYGPNHSLVQDTLANRDLAELELNA